MTPVDLAANQTMRAATNASGHAQRGVEGRGSPHLGQVLAAKATGSPQLTQRTRLRLIRAAAGALAASCSFMART